MLRQHVMSKRTSIYVLFKEYHDPDVRGIPLPYIHNSEDYLIDPSAIVRDWTDLSDVLDFFSYESMNKYYDDDNLEGFLGVAQLFPEEYPCVVQTIMSGMQSTGLTSWKTTPATKTNTFHLGTVDVTNQLLGDMAQREANHLDILSRVKQDTYHHLMPKDKEYEPCVLLQKDAISAPNGEIKLKVNGFFNLKLQSVDSIISLHNWMSQHRFPYRHYAYNSKHGDANNLARTYKNRHGHVVQAAQLLTTTGATRSLLKKAIGYFYEGDLWYYDDANNCYIYFENQGDTPQHEYHAYHLLPGDRNFEKIDVVKLGKVHKNKIRD